MIIAASSLDARFALVPEASNLRKVTYRVRRGDTLHSVARRYSVNEKDVILWNNLTSPSTVRRPAPRTHCRGRRQRATAKRGKKQAAAQSPRTQKSAPAKTRSPRRQRREPARNSKVVAVAR